MADIPNRPPLWQVMRTAYDCSTAPNGTTDDWTERDGFAAEIRALRDWLIQQCRNEGIDQDARNSIYGMLTAEADRAEQDDNT